MGGYGDKGPSLPRVEYSYSYQTPPGGREGQEESLEIKLRWGKNRKTNNN